MCTKDTEILGSTEPWYAKEEQPDPKQHLFHPTQPKVRAIEICASVHREKREYSKNRVNMTEMKHKGE
jgi:hypothetical protein